MLKYKYGIIVLLLIHAFFFLSGCQTQKESYLEIYSMKQERVLQDFPVHEGAEFRLEYIHSSEKTPVYDFFEVNNSGSIILTEECFDWYAVGLECHADYDEADIFFDDRKTRVFLNRIFETLPIRVGWIADQVIFIGQERIVLKDITEPGDLLHITIARK